MPPAPWSVWHCRSRNLVSVTPVSLLCLHAGFHNLRSLVKLQASYNPFESLPADMWQLPLLELFRLAVGRLRAWPAQLGASHVEQPLGRAGMLVQLHIRRPPAMASLCANVCCSVFKACEHCVFPV
jgi:hypothetical protein